MRFRALILFLMIGWDFSLHLADVLNFWEKYPLYPIFPLWGIISYNIFWTCFWGLGAIIAFTLIFASKVNVKNKTDVHVHIDKGVIEDAKKKEENNSN